jgi:kinetochor protein Mis14/NSL1
MEIDTSTLHPNHVSNPHHRKIELQSLLDFTYLQSNLAASARQKLDLHFPPSASQPQSKPSSEPSAPSDRQNDTIATDPMRQRVQDLVDQFLERTWTAAKQSISINGQDATTVLPPAMDSTTSAALDQPREEREGVDFEYEPYDARLSSKVARLYGELEALTAQVSNLRRTAPGAAAERYNRALLEALEEDQRAFEARKEEVAVVDRGGGDGRNGGVLKLDDMREGWQEDVAEMYERGLGELRKLGGHSGSGVEGSGSLTETVGKAQRAKVVAMELE